MIDKSQVLEDIDGYFYWRKYQNKTIKTRLVKGVCKKCNKEFFDTKSHIKTGRGIFCSRKCSNSFIDKSGKNNPMYGKRGKLHPKWVKRLSLKCVNCSKPLNNITPSRTKNKKNLFCSRQCNSSFYSSGDKNYFWGGGIKISRGYKSIYEGKGKYIFEHRKAMETLLGRKLNKNEIIHHIDGDKLNNDINNLLLFKTQKDHAKHHGLLQEFSYKLIKDGIIRYDKEMGIYAINS